MSWLRDASDMARHMTVVASCRSKELLSPRFVLSGYALRSASDRVRRGGVSNFVVWVRGAVI